MSNAISKEFTKNTPLVLVIADGMGMPQPKSGKCAISEAYTPNLDKLLNQETHRTQINTSGKYSGLPEKMMGNSEAGHMAIGSGREVEQIINKVYDKIKKNEFKDMKNEKDNDAQYVKASIDKMKETGGTMHIGGILSDEAGAVHGHISYLYEMAKVFSDENIPVKLHVFTDGRDTTPGEAKSLMKELESKIESMNDVKIATVSGRHYAMDRDKNWNRTEFAFEAIANGKNSDKEIVAVEYNKDKETGKVQEEIKSKILSASSAIEAVEQSETENADVYDALVADKKSPSRKNPDEIIMPTVIGDYEGMDAEKDGFFLTNHRQDRAIQICHAITDTNFDNDKILELDEKNKAKGFVRSKAVSPAATLAMAYYDKSLNEDVDGKTKLMPNLFSVDEVKNTLAQVLSAAGLDQLHVAETEKFKHVTSFFNGGKGDKAKGEKWELVDSPKVASYALAPKMSAQEVTNIVTDSIREGNDDVIIVNLANPDMVGHTGDLEAAKHAMVQVDKNIGEINAALKLNGGVGILIADHGNAEEMIHKKHTTGPVPFVMFGDKKKLQQYKVDNTNKEFGLKDVAPTMLEILGLRKPKEMTGQSICSPLEVLKKTAHSLVGSFSDGGAIAH